MLVRFAAVGAIGFIVDAGLLTLLVSLGGWHHYSARAISFAVAVTITWLCNRSWVFTKTDRAHREYLGYFSVQVAGALINLGTYVVVIETWPALSAVPVIPLAIGASLALIFNFLASRRFVFAASPSIAASNVGSAPSSSYSGRENLEAMKHAQNYNRYLIDLIKANAPGNAVLDFGAGGGTFAAPMSAAGFDVRCIEPDAALQQELESQALLTYGDLEQIPRDSIDYVYTLNVLEHIEDDQAALDSLAAKLKANGRILIYVPAFQCLFSSMDRKVGHFRRYRSDQLKARVQRSGLQVETARYVDSAGFFASLIFKWFGSDSGEISPRSVALYDRIAFPVSKLADLFLSRVLGKNLLVVASKKG